MKLDINCDLGEIDPSLHLEKSLMPFLTRCNIACGGHAGNVTTIKETMMIANEHNVKIGLHPSYADTENFGRKDMNISIGQLQSDIAQQLESAINIADKLKLNIDHIKAHGALYHTLNNDKTFADAYIQTVQSFGLDKKLVYIVKNKGALHQSCVENNCAVLFEIFADRRYDDRGELIPRSQRNAIIEHAKQAAENTKERLKAFGLQNPFINPEDLTICVHSDSPKAMEILQSIQFLEI